MLWLLAIPGVILLIAGALVHFAQTRQQQQLKNKITRPASAHLQLVPNNDPAAYLPGGSKHATLAAAFLDHAVGYDPAEPQLQALQRFQSIARHTECYFAKTAKLWACRNWDPRLSLETNVAQSVNALIKFQIIAKAEGDRLQASGSIKALRDLDPVARDSPQEDRSKRDIAVSDMHDGFVIEVRGMQYHHSLQALGETVRRVLTCLGQHDPSYFAENRASRPMERSYISDQRWNFEFLKEMTTVTTFGACYGANNSRHAFEDRPCGLCDAGSKLVTLKSQVEQKQANADSSRTEAKTTTVVDDAVWAAHVTRLDPMVIHAHESCFLLLQPESSFLRRYDVLGPGQTHSQTNFDKPVTIRDKTRRRFRDSGRPYEVSETDEGAVPACRFMLRPLGVKDATHPWWVTPGAAACPIASFVAARHERQQQAAAAAATAVLPATTPAAATVAQ